MAKVKTEKRIVPLKVQRDILRVIDNLKNTVQNLSTGGFSRVGKYGDISLNDVKNIIALEGHFTEANDELPNDPKKVQRFLSDFWNTNWIVEIVPKSVVDKIGEINRENANTLEVFGCARDGTSIRKKYDPLPS